LSRAGVWMGVGALLVVTACADSSEPVPSLAQRAAAVDTTGLRDLPVPEEHAAGKRVFDLHCAQCHGQAALGTDHGPPLVHITYEPSHHADIAFVFAVQRGVRAHHWRFGDMPPIPAVTAREIPEVIGYIRWLQRQAGIY
jgi:cytochrome c